MTQSNRPLHARYESQTRSYVLAIAIAHVTGCAVDVGAAREDLTSREPTTALAVSAEEQSTPTMSGVSTVKQLAEVTDGDGTRYRFLSIGPAVGVLAVGREGAVRRIQPGETPAEYFRDVSEGSEPPAAISKASGRGRRPARASRPLEPDHVPASAPQPDQAPHRTDKSVGVNYDRLDWIADRCDFSDPAFPLDVEWLWVTGYGSKGWNDVTWFHTSARAEIGQIHFVARTRPWYTWETVADEWLNPGLFGYFEVWDDWDFDSRAYVDNADGDTYDFCIEAKR